MEQTVTMNPIAHIRSSFPEKFGIPRQGGLADTRAMIIFEPEYRAAEAFRGMEEYSHIWLLWVFSECADRPWSPTVRPPRLGGNLRKGVFATRSPFRPNPIGLSCVRLENIELDTPEGPVLHVLGVDLLDGTPILDIKPYLPYVDSHPEAAGGFADEVKEYELEVDFLKELRAEVTEEERHIICQLLAQDPRPSYQQDPMRVYGMRYADLEVKFTVDHKTVHVVNILKGNAGKP
ncbi:tRNA (N6-threonylcarbamoyladenosine(37)-N6)-methyltransferase TrmO [Lachnospiraceae bacterium]|jgi:tRNA-Thr(GGU) m(6)t(6)A37 methyltransferase TsaA|nr:tRNA (N6-threonylcarbamoyladenosine(37)-N6)-methyltransferase TrmO [uncultured Schaedlerella sp.]EOS40963.1 hypothetical protein C808_00127 [Lachnospiraceae bacterium M18-1]MCI9155248.1 tRNA (N6-threonylcarbamoyladenosine(37)-N6)-methyltransferase TrmO [Ruminococcus sp.]NBI57018.1 tRNA (N6-threonylcarbamoyladenosine(37)-N6)-methyltransferase TrmO [Lachnospiraceae bacterium]